MALLFSDQPYVEVVAGLGDIGYKGSLLEEDYAFVDWFRPGMEERQIAAAAFGQTPVSYDSALIGVVCSNGLSGQSLINQYRALGAPVILEIDKYEVRQWAVSGKENGHALVESYPIEHIREIFVSHASQWQPESLLRAKNIGAFHWTEQLGLFAGLLPELEEQIQAKLEPLLLETLFSTKTAYLDATGRNPNSTQLFTLIFWLLTAKVFHDRRVNGFISLGPDPDELLAAIARRYNSDVPSLLTRQAREVAASLIWTTLDFRNLSVEVLSQLWADLLIDDDLKQQLGLVRTSRTIVRYIVERIIPSTGPEILRSGDDRRIIFEPCAGSAVFLIGAMNALRHKLFGMSADDRHRYFVKHLVAMETDPAGVAISRLALTLADFPNPNNWNIIPGDVFEPGTMTSHLQSAGAVFCNPPFGEFSPTERAHYQITSPYKPVELLRRVLDDLHDNGVLGFVLPRVVIDGQSYREIRKRLAERFANVEFTVLPDRAFDRADTEAALLVATDPILHTVCRVVHRRVNDNAEAWKRFELLHEISAEHVADFDINQAVDGLAIPALPEIWDHLVSYPKLSELADLHRGVEWNLPLVKAGVETGNRARFVRLEPTEGYMRGVAPQTNLNVFETPRTFYLSVRPQDQRRNAYEHAWEKPKAILYKFARSRGPWRMAAFPDSEGIVCSGAYIGVWPKSVNSDEWMLSAILNSPIANSFVATREGKFHVTLETLKRIPMPYFTESQRQRLRSLIQRYRKAIASPMILGSGDPERFLMEIDALVLDGYRLPPRLETELLNFFRGFNQDRPTPHDFGDYLPADCEVYFSLSDHLSPKFKNSTVGELLKRMRVS